MKRTVKGNKTVQARRRRAFKVRIVLLSVLFLTIFIGAFWLLHQPYSRAQEYEISGLNLLVNSKITKAINIHTTGYYGAFLIPKDSLFFYPKKRIEKTLKQTYSEIKEISVSKHILHQSIQVKIKEHEPEYKYCIGNTCYLLNSQALVFSRLENEAPLKIVRTYNKQYKIGQAVTAERYFKSLNELREGLESKGLEVTHVSFDEFNNGFIHFPNEGTILVLPEENYDQVFTRFNYLLTTDVFKINEETKSLVPSVTYINFRHGNKVFYCLSKNEECKENYAEYRN